MFTLFITEKMLFICLLDVTYVLTFLLKHRPHSTCLHPVPSYALSFANAMFTGLPAHQYRRLQSVLSATALLIYQRRRFDHVTSPLLRRPSLVEGAGESRLQAGCDCLSVPTWHGTALSVRRPAMCRRTESALAAFFSVQRSCRPINQNHYCQ